MTSGSAQMAAYASRSPGPNIRRMSRSVSSFTSGPGRLRRRHALEHLHQGAQACVDVAVLALVVLAGAEELVGDVEGGQREGGQRVLHAAFRERLHALF